jgi:hypothetical protein
MALVIAMSARREFAVVASSSRRGGYRFVDHNVLRHIP